MWVVAKILVEPNISSLVIANVVNAPAKFKKSEVKQILEKLEKCYNTDHDPRTEEYKKKRLEQFQKLTDYETKYLVSNLRIDFVSKHPWCFSLFLAVIGHCSLSVMYIFKYVFKRRNKHRYNSENNSHFFIREYFAASRSEVLATWCGSLRYSSAIVSRTCLLIYQWKTEQEVKEKIKLVDIRE